MHLRNWWDNVVTFDPLLGFIQMHRSRIKPIEEEKARQIFQDNNIEVTIEEKVTLEATSEVRGVRPIMLKN